MDKLTIKQACTHLTDGHVIAYPTEAVWGLGCDPFNADAVRKILQLKHRDEAKGLILVAASMSQLESVLAPLSDDKLQKLAATWPGPVTWLIPDPDNVYPAWIKGQHQSVAIRVSAHPVVRALCEAFDGPIVSTSANQAGEPEIRSRLIIEEQFGASIDYIVPGDLGQSSRPSEIRDLSTDSVIR